MQEIKQKFQAGVKILHSLDLVEGWCFFGGGLFYTGDWNGAAILVECSGILMGKKQVMRQQMVINHSQGSCPVFLALKTVSVSPVSFNLLVLKTLQKL